jgi:fructosamine-3-kinase
MDEDARARLEHLLGSRLAALQPLGGGHGVRHYRLTLADGRSAFAKMHNQLPSGNAADAVPAEAQSLRWLGEAGAAPVPAVLASDSACLVTEWIEAAQPAADAAATFGRELARLHAAGAQHFGAPWRGVIASLPLPNDEADFWPDWYAANRLLPYLKIAADVGTLSPADTRLIEKAAARSAELAGPPEPPSRIHGDCWSGNVLWSGGRGWLIDPAAHGGHRETDVAMLALFGAPFLGQIMAAYAEAVPLADGWRARVPLHQLHPLLVHVCLFGGSYRDAAVNAARQVLAS